MPQLASLYSLPAEVPVSDLLYRGGMWSNALQHNAAGEIVAIHITTGGYAEWLPLIEACTTLQVLVWQNCPLQAWEVPASLCALRWLDLSESETLQSLSFAGAMPELERIEAHHCPELRSVAIPAGCAELHTVDVSRNPELGTFAIGRDCPALFHIDASHTAIKEFRVPPGCEQLALLYLHDGRLNTLVFDAVSPPKGLRTLHVAHTQLRALPDLGALRALENVRIESVPLTAVPEEVANMPMQERIDFLRAMQQGGSKPFNEAKVLLVGEPNVGKTSIVEMFTKRQFNTERNPTMGVNLPDEEHQITISEHHTAGEITVNFWDFGGHQILQTAHTMFFKGNSVYLVVVNPKNEGGSQGDVNLKYWLDTVRSAAPDAPIIVVFNKIQDHPYRPEHSEYQAYNIVAWVETPRITENTLDLTELRKELETAVESLPDVRQHFPVPYHEVKQALVRMRTEKQSHLTYEQYEQKCTHPIFQGQEGISHRRTALRVMDQIGAIVHLERAASLENPTEDTTYVLEPNWVTNGIYAILTSDILAKGEGCLPRLQLKDGSILSKAVYAKQENFLVEVMKDHHLCWEKDRQTLLFPDAFPLKEPDWVAGYQADADALTFEFEYSAYQRRLLSFLTAKMHHKLATDRKTAAWGNGMLLSFPDHGTQALVTGNKDKRTIRFAISGNPFRRRDSFAVLYDQMAELHKAYFDGVTKTGYIVLAGIRCPYTYQELIEMYDTEEDRKIVVRFSATLKRTVEEVMEGYSTPEQRRGEKQQPAPPSQQPQAHERRLQTIKIFIASSFELKEDREQFEIFINRQNKQLVKKGIFLELILWEDFLDTVSATRLQDEYNKELITCDFVVCLFFTKVGKFTAEEFDTALGQFRTTGKPRILTYFKDAPISTGSITKEIQTLLTFKEKLHELGHFPTSYHSMGDLKHHFDEQLKKVGIG